MNNLKNVEAKINPRVMAPPILNVLKRPVPNRAKSDERHACMVLYIVSPGTSGIMPGIRYTVTGALKIRAATSEYIAIEKPDRKYGNTREGNNMSAIKKTA